MEQNLLLIAATGNKHKIEEISAVTENFGIRLISRAEAGLPDDDPEETGDSFEENARIKAQAALAGLCGGFDGFDMIAAIADDSGIVVDALDGAPGIYSARFADGDDESNNEKLLRLMKDVPPLRRTARFVCVLVLLYADGRDITVCGECEGHIALSPAGENGFGYDPLFIPLEYAESGLSFAQISSTEKNRISHRGKALARLGDALGAYGIRGD